MKTLPAIGTEIYYTGDMANADGFGKVSAHRSAAVDLQMEDGRNILGLSIAAISERYEGHCGTRFVTREAYSAWHKERLAQLEAVYGKR